LGLLSVSCALVGLALAARASNPPGGAAAAPGTPEVPVTSIGPIFHQLVMFSLPRHFKTVLEKSNEAVFIREHVPNGESADKWTQMITVTAAKDLASNPKVTPRVFLERIAAGMRRNCPDTFSAVTLGPRTISGEEAFGVVTGCGRVQAGGEMHAETAIMLAVKGAEDYYTLQWAERGPASDQPPTIDATSWAQRLMQLNPIRFCPIVPGEAAPYPSCSGGAALP
jgi:hypothetical protein